ncbi:uroporphyrinogen-III synthase [Pontibacillus salipaludis]|uniref:Uroporphyrinogen-III synthase n=1 Tax=Pontibacillus salipaludis TaxID=1697394 RepID=A0ABQ1PTX5_9BACI|nr:uroporphyrinogen-III synthase [Pontibacillus salipaludis]GGD03363.1 uroporphyrinogen-III synthase [Pontibacillus salipaludis]
MFPLKGRRILVTRSAEQAASFTNCIEQQSGISVEIPLLYFKSVPSLENMDILRRLNTFKWIIFTSSNGVHFFMELCERYQIPLSVIKERSIAAVGRKTANTLAYYNVETNFMPDTYTGEALGEAFLNERDHGAVLVVQGNLARQKVVETIRPYMDVETAIMYETRVNVKIKEVFNRALQENQLDALTFTSPSTVKAFKQLIEPSLFEHIQSTLCMCIGPTTEKEAEQAGFTHRVIPDHQTVEGMCEALGSYFREKGNDDQ